MKKIVLSFIFIMAVAIQMNANTDPEKKEDRIKQVTTEAEIPGCASDCVQWAKEQTFQIADDIGDHPNDEPFYMEIYMRYYEGCYRGC